MMNSIETYVEAGRKAAKAMRNRDMGAHGHFANWASKAIRLESGQDKLNAQKAYRDAYQTESGFVPFR